MNRKRSVLISRLNCLYWENYDSPGRAIDEAIQIIRDAGVSDYNETNSILGASDYSLELPGSVTSLVMSIKS